MSAETSKNGTVTQQPTMGEPPAYPGPPGKDQHAQQPQPQNPQGGWPQPNTTCPGGLEYLIPLDKIFIDQKIEGWEVALGMHMKNRYRIANIRGETIYAAKEESSCCMRMCFGSGRGFVVNVTDVNGREAIRIERPLLCFGNACDVYSGDLLLGTVRQTICSCTPEFKVYDATGRLVFKITGPLCICGCETSFTILSATHDVEVGEIKKHWTSTLRELFTNADVFGVSFPMDLDVRVKALLVGAAILIDFAYFEVNQ